MFNTMYKTTKTEMEQSYNKNEENKIVKITSDNKPHTRKLLGRPSESWANSWTSLSQKKTLKMQKQFYHGTKAKKKEKEGITTKKTFWRGKLEKRQFIREENNL